jgi:hypothetical protein
MKEKQGKTHEKYHRKKNRKERWNKARREAKGKEYVTYPYTQRTKRKHKVIEHRTAS